MRAFLIERKCGKIEHLGLLCRRLRRHNATTGGW
jgi:hypothetical protein